jgi:putative hydrolase of the HAD superfamily
MTAAILFDLGNTLAAYYHASEFRPILADAIGGVRDELGRRRLCDISLEAALDAAIAENSEASDYRFRPMIERLERIFQVPLANDLSLAAALCERFLAPIFAVGRVYDDALPVLGELRSAGVRTAIVSNAPWGSPADLWRKELQRLNLADAVDAVVLCGDVGWRKPAPDIFRYAISKVGCRPADCVFVGDDIRWDIEGSSAVGMRPILIDRDGRYPTFAGERIGNLQDVLAVVDADA